MQEVLLCFLDISKAFDRVSHNAIINKLRYFKIDGKLLDLLKDYLTSRKQRVTLDGKTSSWRDIFAGVPQGSVLGPLLFLIFIDDIVQNINCLIRLFADDTSLLLASDVLRQDIALMQTDINRIIDWANKWSVRFNPEKTECLLISRRRVPSQIKLYFNDLAVEQVNSHKHLGLTLNSNANWNTHLDEIITKANKRLGIMRNLKYKLSRDALKTIYITYIRSLLEYAAVVWDNIPAYQTQRLERINKTAIRCITGLTISAHRNSLYHESGLEPLATRRKFLRLVQFYKIINNLCPQYLSDLLPAPVQARNRYPVRNANNINSIRCNTESFKSSFYPQTVDDWNNLPENVKSATSIPSFKYRLRHIQDFQLSCPPKWFSVGDRKVNILHAQLRNKCSPLANDLFENHVIASPICTRCRANKVEDSFHFFIECSKYNNMRQTLSDSITLNQFDFNVDTILNGDPNRNFNEHLPLVQSIHLFIVDSERFQIW